MSSAKLVVAAGAAVLALSGCGGLHANPQAGSANVSQGRGKVDDPRVHHPDHVACLRQDGLAVQLVGLTDLRIGGGGGPFVHFAASPGDAQADQIHGTTQYQGAEVIGSALLFPNQASDSELKMIETCLAQNVTG
jgi:hypothetical protein